MKMYYRVRLGEQAAFAEQCFAESFIGADYGIAEDLKGKLPESWRDFNSAYIPVFLANRPHKSKIAAGLACGVLWTIGRGMQDGDIVLCPDGPGRFRVGEITGDYLYVAGASLPHRRPVSWLPVVIDRERFSDGLWNAIRGPGTVCNIRRTGYADEVESLIGERPPTGGFGDPTIEDLAAFAMESHLEEFLVANWPQTELGKLYDIYHEDGEQVGQQYPTDTGPMDILAISKDKQQLLVVELKKGRASDAVIGQILRYMGYVQEELAERSQIVRGAIIALEDDQRIRRALAVTPNIGFYRYQISFRLVKS